MFRGVRCVMNHAPVRARLSAGHLCFTRGHRDAPMFRLVQGDGGTVERRYATAQGIPTNGVNKTDTADGVSRSAGKGTQLLTMQCAAGNRAVTQLVREQ